MQDSSPGRRDDLTQLNPRLPVAFKVNGANGGIGDPCAQPGGNMQWMQAAQVEETINGLARLRSILANELDAVDGLMRALDASLCAQAGVDAGKMMQTYGTARANIRCGLASIDEVLGWIHLVAEPGADGRELECVKELPYLYALRR